MEEVNVEKLKEVVEAKMLRSDSIADVSLKGYRERIALWHVCKEEMDDIKCGYLYTDLEGNLLFDGMIFDEALFFANGFTVVTYKGINYILHARRKEIIQFPDDISHMVINSINQNYIIVGDGLVYHFDEEYAVFTPATLTDFFEETPTEDDPVDFGMFQNYDYVLGRNYKDLVTDGFPENILSRIKPESAE